MDIQLSVFKGKADVGDLDCATIVVLNDDKFPMDIDIPPEDLLKTTNQLKMVYGFIEHNYHILKNEFWWCCAYKLVPALCWLVGNILMLDTLQVMELCQEGTPTPSKKTWSYVKGDDGDDYSGDCVAGSIMWVWILAVCYIINHGIAFTVDCSIGDLKLGGKATRALRTDIFAVMLQVTGAWVFGENSACIASNRLSSHHRHFHWLFAPRAHPHSIHPSHADNSSEPPLAPDATALPVHPRVQFKVRHGQGDENHGEPDRGRCVYVFTTTQHHPRHPLTPLRNFASLPT